MTKKKLVLPDSPHLHADQAGRLCAPSAARNLAPIRDKLDPLLPDAGKVLELASGTGQQITALAEAHPNIIWQPSDLDPERLASIRAWQQGYSASNLNPPVALDVAGPWPASLTGFDLIYVVNLFHLIPKADAVAAIASASRALGQGGVLFIYGPFIDNGTYRSDGDRSFDHSLRRQNPDIGYKDRVWMEAQFTRHGMTLDSIHDMPANNLVLVARLC